MLASTPTIVPCITVPFFNSIVTASLLSFCSNLTSFMVDRFEVFDNGYVSIFENTRKEGCLIQVFVMNDIDGYDNFFIRKPQSQESQIRI